MGSPEGALDVIHPRRVPKYKAIGEKKRGSKTCQEYSYFLKRVAMEESWVMAMGESRAKQFPDVKRQMKFETLEVSKRRR